MKRNAGSLTGSGVITVYLALILLLILSLICAIIEGARISTAKVYAKRALSTAMDSVWAEYYGPLWEEYHIFGYDAGTGSMSERAAGIEEKLTEYMSYTFDPGFGMESVNDSAEMELYDIKTASVSVTEQTRLMDYNGKLLINEAVEYMKYHELGDDMALLLDKLSLLEKPKKVSYVYEKKLSAEEELSKADKNILRLMELLDGIETTKKGIRFDSGGKLISKEYFAKKLCLNPVTMESVGINHKMVFDAVKENYINPAEIVTRFESKAEELNSLENQIASLQEEASATMGSLSKLQVQQQTVEHAISSKKEKQQNDALKEEREELQNHLEELQGQIEEYREKIRQVRSEAEAELISLEYILQELLPITEEAIEESGAIKENTAKAAAFIEAFEESINEYEDDLNEETRKSFMDTLSQMKRYTSDCEGDENYNKLSDILKHNHAILLNSKESIHSALEYFQKKDVAAARAEISQALSQLQNYHIKELSLDYSGLVVNKEKYQNPIEEIGKLIENGITGLVVDPEQISDKKIKESQLPSIEAALQEDTSNYISKIKAFFADWMEGGDKKEMTSLFLDFSNTDTIESGMEEGISLVLEHLLYQEYLKEHFTRYQVKEGAIIDRKPSALDYEQEYLLIGNSSAKENLSSVIARIVFIRMMLNFVTLIGDKTRCEEAKLAATAMVGFSGLPILISITQAVLLLVWSFTESLVDTCALLNDKEVPVLKQKFLLQLPEMFLMNRSFLKSKAETYTESEQLCLSYGDYLRLFLLTKEKEDLACRSMDVIQENLRIRYEESFTFQNCLYGFSAETDSMAGSRFLAIPIVRRGISHNISGFTFRSTSAYCY